MNQRLTHSPHLGPRPPGGHRGRPSRILLTRGKTDTIHAQEEVEMMMKKEAARRARVWMAKRGITDATKEIVRARLTDRGIDAAAGGEPDDCIIAAYLLAVEEATQKDG